MRAAFKHRAFSSVAIITSILFVANIRAQLQVAPGSGSGATPANSTACNPTAVEVTVKIQGQTQLAGTSGTPAAAGAGSKRPPEPDDEKKSGIVSEILVRFMGGGIEGMLRALKDDDSADGMTQINPLTIEIEPQTATGSGDSVLKYTPTGDKPTPKDPKLTAWEGLRGVADSLEATGDPNFIRLARAIRIQAEGIFQAPVSTVSSATGSVPSGARSRLPVDPKIMVAILVMQLGLMQGVIGKGPSATEMMQIDPPTPPGATGSGDSILKYTQTGDKPTPPDPRLKRWEELWERANRLEASGDPDQIRQARELKIEAEGIFQAPVSTVSSATGSLPPGSSPPSLAAGPIPSVSPAGLAGVETPSGTYVVSASQLSGSFGVFRLSPGTGLLSPIGSVPSGGKGPAALSIVDTKGGTFVTVANHLSDSLGVFRLSPGTGLLSPIGSVPSGGKGPAALSIVDTKGGTFVTVANHLSDSLGVFRLSPGTGLLSPIGSVPSGGKGPAALSIVDTKGGTFVTVANHLSDSLGVFRLSPGTGLLSPIGSVPSGGKGPAALSIVDTKGGTFVTVANHLSDSLGVFRLSPGTGLLSPIGSVPSGGKGPAALSIVDTKGGTFVTVANHASNNLSSLKIDPATGTLTPIASVPSGGNGPAGLSIVDTKGGTFVVVANHRSNNLSSLKIDPATGTLTPIASVSAGGKEPAGVSTVETKGGYTINIDLKIPSLLKSAFPGGLATVTNEPPLLASLLRAPTSTKLPANIGGIWTILDAKIMPSLTSVNEGISKVYADYLLASIEFYTAIEELDLLIGDKPLSSLPLLHLTVPKLHVELDGSEDSDFLTPYEDKGQILIDTKINLAPGATPQIGWWPKNGLAEAKPTIPNAGFNSFDVSKISSFFKPNVTHVSSWLSNADCLAIFPDAAKPSFTELNAGRNVAPAPSLDPAYWPKAEPEPQRVSLSAEE